MTTSNGLPKRSQKERTFFDPDLVAQAVEKITTDKEGSGINAGPSDGGGGGGGGEAVPSAGGKDKEGPGIDAGPSMGSEGDGGGGGPLPDKTPLPNAPPPP